MMIRLLDPNIPEEMLSNEQLLKEYLEPKGTGKWNYYALLARRASTSPEILDLLLDIIVSEKARSERAMGFVMHAWLPAIFILKDGNENTISYLCEKLKCWTSDELTEFKSYLKSDPDMSKHLTHLDAFPPLSEE
jgi:hypothetical protein